jgi:hypothetical protein
MRAFDYTGCQKLGMEKLAPRGPSDKKTDLATENAEFTEK